VRRRAEIREVHDFEPTRQILKALCNKHANSPCSRPRIRLRLR
jgi:hypothetical protein